jgi:PPM family protein phosphatase
MKIGTSWFGETNIGKRSNNEDSLCKVQLSESLLLLAVADGMGGTAGGERASKIAIETLINIFKNNTLNKDASYLKHLLRSAYRAIQDQIADEIRNDPSLKGMGTTLNAALIIDGNKIIHSNLGDSRIYLFQRNKLIQLSKDHSYVQEFKDKNLGDATPAFLRNYSNYITRSLDGGQDIPDIFPEHQDFLALKKGSILLVCSDGLILHQTDEPLVIKSLLLNNDLERATSALIENAIERGSTDNITVILYEYGRHKRTSSLLKYFQRLLRGKKFQENDSQRKSFTLSKANGVAILIICCILLLTFLTGLYFMCIYFVF